MEVNSELKKLAKEFENRGHRLYIVGGFVRNHLLGLESDDIDITSNMPEEKVVKVCNKLKAKAKNINATLGTIQIIYNSFQFEYTRFRSESYLHNGNHTPEAIKFIDDIEVDCNRRDFTINSLYYDILEDRIIDIPCGQKDLEKRVIKTTQDPEITFADDALRTLRAIRFAATLNFKIEHKTLKAMQIFVPYLKNISKERVLKELDTIVKADLIHGNQNTFFLELCNRLKLPQYIFNSTLSRCRKFSKKDITSFYQLCKDARLIGFYILILKNHLKTFTSDNQLCYIISTLLGPNGIKESNHNIFSTEKIYRIFQNLKYNNDSTNAAVNYLTLSDTERNIIDNFLDKKSKQELDNKIQFIKDNNLPINVHQLDLCAEDLIKEGIEKKYISKILSTLFNQVLNISVPNNKKDLIKLAKEINETFNKLKEIT